jgi:hypothetical protein
VREKLDELNRELAHAVEDGKLPASGPISTYVRAEDSKPDDEKRDD